MDCGEENTGFEANISCRLMNVGSPYNVPAGSQVSMEKVIEKYKKIAYEENERKLEALRTNQVPSEQPLKPRILKGSENSS